MRYAVSGSGIAQPSHTRSAVSSHIRYAVFGAQIGIRHAVLGAQLGIRYAVLGAQLGIRYA
eukprot:1230909-Rhodomonas_salina.1